MYAGSGINSVLFCILSPVIGRLAAETFHFLRPDTDMEGGLRDLHGFA